MIFPISSVYGYEYYETYGYMGVDHDNVIVCYVDTEDNPLFYDITVQGVDAWQSKLKEFTNNFDVWNISVNSISANEVDDSNTCDMYVEFISTYHEEFYADTGVADFYEKEVISFYYLEEDNSIISDNILLSTMKHELGHAFGLGHYITNNESLLEQWDKGMDVPSIMVEYTGEIAGFEEITELDLQKMVSIYGVDGFDDKKSLPDWIKNIFTWYGQGTVSEDELISSIEFLVKNGYITI